MVYFSFCIHSVTLQSHSGLPKLSPFMSVVVNITHVAEGLKGHHQLGQGARTWLNRIK